MLVTLLPTSTAAGQTTAAPAPYRAPTIAMVQPVPGGTVPRDRPVVVFRFARGEAADPIDAQTFAVRVDGVDRTALFQITADEAWGPLDKSGASADSLMTPGSHAVIARVCSIRGACVEAVTTVVAIESTTSPATQPAAVPVQTRSTRTRVIDLVLEAVRKLIVP